MTVDNCQQSGDWASNGSEVTALPAVVTDGIRVLRCVLVDFIVNCTYGMQINSRGKWLNNYGRLIVPAIGPNKSKKLIHLIATVLRNTEPPKL